MKYFIGYMVTIGLLILLIVFLIKSGGNNAPAVQAKTLDSYATSDAEVSYLNSGPINAESLHREIKITVDNDYVTYQEIAGYNGHVIRTKRFSNNVNAYSNFLAALGRAGFAKGAKTETTQTEKGACSLGNRYVFEMTQGTDQIQRNWTTNCGSGGGTFKGDISTTITLFEAQVPDYNTLSSQIVF